MNAGIVANFGLDLGIKVRLTYYINCRMRRQSIQPEIGIVKYWNEALNHTRRAIRYNQQ